MEKLEKDPAGDLAEIQSYLETGCFRIRRTLEVRDPHCCTCILGPLLDELGVTKEPHRSVLMQVLSQAQGIATVRSEHLGDENLSMALAALAAVLPNGGRDMLSTARERKTE